MLSNTTFIHGDLEAIRNLAADTSHVRLVVLKLCEGQKSWIKFSSQVSTALKLCKLELKPASLDWSNQAIIMHRRPSESTGRHRKSHGTRKLSSPLSGTLLFCQRRFPMVSDSASFTPPRLSCWRKLVFIPLGPSGHIPRWSCYRWIMHHATSLMSPWWDQPSAERVSAVFSWYLSVLAFWGGPLNLSSKMGKRRLPLSCHWRSVSSGYPRVILKITKTSRSFNTTG